MLPRNSRGVAGGVRLNGSFTGKGFRGLDGVQESPKLLQHWNRGFQATKKWKADEIREFSAENSVKQSEMEVIQGKEALRKQGNEGNGGAGAMEVIQETR